jgi:predicted HTH transcriptional regulator
LNRLKNCPKATRKEIAVALGNITENDVKFNINSLKQFGVLKRTSSLKEGEWVVLVNFNNCLSTPSDN